MTTPSTCRSQPGLCYVTAKYQFMPNRIITTYIIWLSLQIVQTALSHLKEGACYCYCAYVLCISRYSDFLWMVLINTGIYLRGSKQCEESRNSQILSYPKRKLGLTMHFLGINKLQFVKKFYTLLCF